MKRFCLKGEAAEAGARGSGNAFVQLSIRIVTGNIPPQTAAAWVCPPKHHSKEKNKKKKKTQKTQQQIKQQPNDVSGRHAELRYNGQWLRGLAFFRAQAAIGKVRAGSLQMLQPGCNKRPRLQPSEPSRSALLCCKQWMHYATFIIEQNAKHSETS